MKYNEINTELDKLREIIRGKVYFEKEAREKGKRPPKWDPEELTQLLTDILNIVEAINDTQHKINKKLKENE